MTIEKRIQKAEERLGMDEGEPVVVEIVMFGDGPLPPDRRQGNIIMQHVSYDSIKGRLERASNVY